MALSFSPPKIVTNNLILYLDAANVKSYPRLDATWKDLMSDYSGNLDNSPTFSTDYGGYFAFDGVNDGGDFDINSNLNIDSTHSYSMTVESWCRVPAVNHDTFIVSRYSYNIGTPANGWLLIYGVDTLDTSKVRFRLHGRESSAAYLGSCNTDYIYNVDTWYHVCGVKNGSTWQVYVNSELGVSITQGNGTTPFYDNPFDIAQWDSTAPGNRDTRIDIATVKMYNRALTQSEIAKNYNATKERFV